ncbi:hypothetical protein P775_08335 [Puniceibacterium antarcticum]|uniref:Myb-like domain-containing protein n=1 Tax=Puniceibacterium antarcticum TaxID=1206336 RepID=A0A2G8RG35_9RHOB|nr:hypothetical protein [Puniceibacterium antarcticum]PIL20527.1 hypothetical protein P775_08335 [Puniceibacterium antarcticum]
MTGALDDLRQTLAEDSQILKAKMHALDVLAYCLQSLTTAGFSPDLTDEDGLLVLSVDPDVITLPGLVQVSCGVDFSAEAGGGSQQFTVIVPEGLFPPKPIVTPSAPDGIYPPPPPPDVPTEDDVGTIKVSEPVAPEVETVAPEPAPVAPKPVAAKPAPVARKPKVKTGEWTKEEEAFALRLSWRGTPPAEIAEQLNRDRKSVANKLFRLKKSNPQRSKADPDRVSDSIAQAIATRTPLTVRWPGDAPSPTTTNLPIEDDLSIQMGATERAVRHHLRAIGNAAPWTKSADLQLVEMLLRGDGLDAAVAALKVTREAGKNRWNDLCPAKTIKAQEDLVMVLRKRFSEPD